MEKKQQQQQQQQQQQLDRNYLHRSGIDTGHKYQLGNGQRGDQI